MGLDVVSRAAHMLRQGLAMVGAQRVGIVVRQLRQQQGQQVVGKARRQRLRDAIDGGVLVQPAKIVQRFAHGGQAGRIGANCQVEDQRVLDGPVQQALQLMLKRLAFHAQDQVAAVAADADDAGFGR
ncbi:hypothetical protein D3C86_851450 [compost metagenome]